MGKHENQSAIKKISRRLGTSERNEGVDFISNHNAYEYAEDRQDIRNSIGQLQHSRVPGKKALIVPDRLGKEAIKQAKGTGIEVENIQGDILKKAHRLH